MRSLKSFPEHQETGLMSTLDAKLVECLISAAIKHNPIVTTEDQHMLKIQREEKLRRQTLLKEMRLDKVEKCRFSPAMRKVPPFDVKIN